jgi:YidC/Oxa1 family membrane protein insertase
MILAIMASIAVFYLWIIVAVRIWPPTPPATQPAVATAPAAVTQPPVATQAEAPGSAPSTARASAPASAPGIAAASQPSAANVQGGGEDRPLVIGGTGKDSPYPMSLELMPRGAALANARLRDHYQTVERKQPYAILEPVVPPGDGAAAVYSFTTAKIRFDSLNLDVPLRDVIWAGEPLTTNGGVQTKTFFVNINAPDGKPLARVSKTYTLPQHSTESMRYDFDLSLKIDNLSGQPQRIILVQEGPVGFRKEEPRSEDRKVLAALRADGRLTVTGHMRPQVIKKGQIVLGSDDGTTHIAWAAEINKTFASIVTPAGRPAVESVKFSSLEALDLVKEDPAEMPEVTGLTFQFVTAPYTLAPGASEQVAFNCYLGPKSKRAFQDVPAYAQQDYYAVITESFPWCAPGGLIALMMWLLNAFHAIPPHNYGIAIIILVLVVRAILHPITKRSQINMTKMQKQMAWLQPKLTAIKEKYANDRVQQNQAIMEVYQEAGVNPAGQFLSCLPMALQMPIWIALWTALASTIEMRHAPFDGFWIKDLAAPDALITFSPVTIPLISWFTGPIHSLNLLPILLGISQALQTKFMPRGASPQATAGQPDQLEQQRKMMMWMSVIFVLMLYNAPSGLNLYIMASNFFSLLEQWRIRQHIAEEEKRHPGGFEPKKKTERKRSWFSGYLMDKWGELAKQADEAKRAQSPRDKKRK